MTHSIHDHPLTALLATVYTDRYESVPCNVARRQFLLFKVKRQVRSALAELDIDLDVLGNPEIAVWEETQRFTEVFVFLNKPRQSTS
jgi:hypothetical protein